MQKVAIVVRPNRGMMRFLRPFVREPLLSMPVDLDAALAECKFKMAQLRRLGVTVYDLAEVDPVFNRASEDLGDRVFPEDLGVDTGPIYLEAAMTPAERAPEPAVGLPALERLLLLAPGKRRSVLKGHPEARFEAGDRLLFYRNDGTIIMFVATSSRTNAYAVPAIQTIFAEHRELDHWQVVPTSVYADRCLHLTSGSGALGPWTVLVDPSLVHVDPFLDLGIEVVYVHPDEEGHMNNANCLYVPGDPGAVLIDDRFPRTIERVRKALRKYGIEVIPTPNFEHGKGAGGITCRVQRIGIGWQPLGWCPRHDTILAS